MKTTPIFDPIEAGRPMQVAAFMSGSGTNIIKLLERQNRLRDKEGISPFRVVFVFSDRSDGTCQGEKIALEAGIPYISYDIRAFHRSRGYKRTARTQAGLAARRAFDEVAATLVQAFDIDLIALGGYMSYTTLKRCINVHPADLSVKTTDGKRKYVGDDAVYDALAAGETTLRSSTLWTDEGVDTGPMLMVSAPLHVALPQSLDTIIADEKRFRRLVEEHQARLKEVGDWKIFPETVEMIARGRIAFDHEKTVYVDGEPMPEGYRL